MQKFHNKLFYITLGLIGVILLHLFSFIEIPTFKDEDDNIEKVIQQNEQLKHRNDSIKAVYEANKVKTDSIVNMYNTQLDSLQTVNNNIEGKYEEKLKDINDVTIVPNDSITKYISKRIYNR